MIRRLPNLDSQLETVDVTDSFLNTIPREVSTRYIFANEWRTNTRLGLPIVNTEDIIEVPLSADELLTVARTTRILPILSRFLLPLTDYQVIYKHRAVAGRFEAGAPKEEAPDYALDHWRFRQGEPSVSVFSKRRRGDSYVALPTYRFKPSDGFLYAQEHKNMRNLINQALLGVQLAA